jgi:hypothetical protein
MYNFEVFLLVIIVILIINFIISKIEIKKIKEENTNLNLSIDEKSHKIDFKYTQVALDFLDRLIKEKYNFYLYTNLLPIYLDNKIPEKKLVQEIKEKIYVSVVGGLNPDTKKSILTFFTEKGIEIYIHEKIMILMNETDFRTSDKFKESFRNIDPKKVDVILP